MKISAAPSPPPLVFAVAMKLSRFAPLLVPAVLSSGCLQYILVMGNPAQKSAAFHKVIGDAVGDAGEKRDCPRWISGLNGIQEKLPIVDSTGNRTWYGDEIAKAYHTCTLDGLKDLESGPGGTLERSRRAVEHFDRILSLPLGPLKLEDQKVGGMYSDLVRPGEASLRALRAKTAESVVKLEEARAKKVARENKRVELATAAEARGWPLAALAAGLTVDPLDEAMTKAREAAITRLEGPAQRLVAVPVALVPAKTNGAPATVLEQVRTAPPLLKPTLRLVEPGTPGAVQVELTVGPPTRDTQKSSVDFEHTYISGSKMVPNPDLEKLQKDVAYFEKEARWHEEHAASACKGQRDQSKCTTRVTHQNDARRMREKASKAREDLSRAKPTVRQDVKSVFAYTGDKTVFTVSAPLEVAVLAAPGGAPVKQTGTARIERSTIVFPGNPKVGLSPRNDPAPSPEELDAALATAAARLLANGASAAPTQAAAEFDAKASAATEPLEKLQWAVARALRSTKLPDAEAADAIALSTFETKLPGKSLMQALAWGARLPATEMEPSPASTEPGESATSPKVPPGSDTGPAATATP
jgi:hypothetical protein